ncbi:hypothetical protein SAMN05518849_11647 [Sphingobium sp. AP50]|uniref:hypothetical protein n=1 Tax=Sphingobium sp. AP50 TaxID=1884369 RepID=UPI0008ACEAB1|nr:hypothetical protein [Sphingobium sp. AP50]SEJ86997.1 hypothetical protein SAMN05518849_11647 [Sphingobium sp. AP50]
MQTTDITPDTASSSNVIAFPMDRVRRASERPLWASTGLYDLDLMAEYWDYLMEAQA